MVKFLSHIKGSKLNLRKAFKNKFVNQIYLKLYSQYNVGSRVNENKHSKTTSSIINNITKGMAVTRIHPPHMD